jgi:hypothetical protein
MRGTRLWVLQLLVVGHYNTREVTFVGKGTPANQKEPGKLMPFPPPEGGGRAGGRKHNHHKA